MNNETIAHFQHIRSLIADGKAKALQAATVYSLATYWNVGAYLSQRLTEQTYGKGVVSELAKWLIQEQPNLKGCDRRSLYRMRDFFDIWSNMGWSLLPPQFNNNQIIVGKGQDKSEQKIVGLSTPQSFPLPTVLTRLTWSHHVEILKSATSPEEMLFYLALTIKDRYTTFELRRQIKSALFERQMLSKHTLILPEHPQKEELAQIFRDRYLLEFLDLSETFSEAQLQKTLIERMKQFLLELGAISFLLPKKCTYSWA